MMLMCGQSNQVWHYWAGKYPGRVGHLFGPRNMTKQALRKWMPFACDNDAYIAFTEKAKWDALAWHNMLERVDQTGLKPLWVLVPDVVANKEATLKNWEFYAPCARGYGWPLAFAVQDGMYPADVPKDADVVFVGGSTRFKWDTVRMWAENFPHVHVGRVNVVARLWRLKRINEDLGEDRIKSADGSGWFRDPSRRDRVPLLEQWMEGITPDQHELDLEIEPAEIERPF